MYFYAKFIFWDLNERLRFNFRFLIAVSAEFVEVEYELDSDVESNGKDALKLTARARTRQSASASSPARGPQRRTARDETKKEIQEDDEATLRELLIRYIYIDREDVRIRSSLFHEILLVMAMVT